MRSISSMRFRLLAVCVFAFAAHGVSAEPASIPASVHAQLDPATDDVLFRLFADSLHAGNVQADLISDAKARGAGFAIRCAALLDSEKPREAEVICDIISHAGRLRGSNPQLVHVYDRAAHRLFWGDGAADQESLAVALKWQRWPVSLPDAVVRAAPKPTLAWLSQQAASDKPRLAELRSIFRAWGWFARTGGEQQHLSALQGAIVALGKNSALAADAPTHAALLRFAGETKAGPAVQWVIDGLADDSSLVRTEAALAASRLGAADPAVLAQCRDALIGRLVKETDVQVAATLAEAAEAFGNDAKMGEAVLALLQRSRAKEVDRAILFSVAKASWPQRDAIVLAGLQSKDGGVAGAALQAITIRSSPALSDATLKLLETFRPAPRKAELLVPDDADSAQPQLIDALGAVADARAAPRLIEWLEVETNAAIRLKICLTLERIRGDRALAGLQDQLQRETNETVMAQLIAIAGRLQLPGADEVMIALITDRTAPAALRRAAIGSIGLMQTSAVAKALTEISSHPELTLPADDAALSAGKADRLEQAKLMISIAQMRQGKQVAQGTLPELFDKAGPGGQVLLLSTIADLKLDDPAIARGLASKEYAVLWMAVRAAHAINPGKYHATLQAIHDAPFIAAVMASALDSLDLKRALNDAIADGERR